MPNDQMWEIYRISDCFVNLCRTEIFGMAILEAMYYKCPVIALEASGPSYIIENNKSGFWVPNEQEVEHAIMRPDKTVMVEYAYERIINEFTWDSSADKLIQIVKGKMKY